MTYGICALLLMREELDTLGRFLDDHLELIKKSDDDYARLNRVALAVAIEQVRINQANS